jgi:hypothetical protein
MRPEILPRNNPETFRSKSSVVGFFILIFLLAGMNLQTIFSSDFGTSAVTLAWTTCFASCMGLIMYKPKIIFFDEGIEIVNPTFTYLISWDYVREIEARYTMSIITNDGEQIFAWAAPAPGRYHSRKIHESDLRGLSLGHSGSIRSGESPRADSGVARYLAVTRLERYRITRSSNQDRAAIAFMEKRGDFAIAGLAAISALFALAFNLI